MKRERVCIEVCKKYIGIFFYNKCYERERVLFYFLCLKILYDDNVVVVVFEVLEGEECFVIDNEVDFLVDFMKGKFYNSEFILI